VGRTAVEQAVLGYRVAVGQVMVGGAGDPVPALQATQHRLFRPVVLAAPP